LTARAAAARKTCLSAVLLGEAEQCSRIFIFIFAYFFHLHVFTFLEIDFGPQMQMKR
jgi:hypothetical protein